MADSVKQLFDTWAGTERGKSMAQGHDVLVHHILRKWKGDNIDNLLDVGCGNGRALMLAQQAGAKQLAGVDLSDNMIAEAKKLLPNASLYVSPMQDLSMFADASFSHIISVEALYYLQDPKPALQEMRRVLKPDGKIAVAIDYYEESKGTHSWEEALAFDINLMAERTWVNLFKEAGFEDISSSRILRMNNIKTKEEFTPSSFFTSYELYQDYIASGALLLAN